MGSDSAPRQNGTAAFVSRLLDDVDGRSPVPLYEQIAARLRAAIGNGVLAAGDALPSVRQLAAGLRINPATVVQAYRLMESEGFADMRQGAGSFVRVPPNDLRDRQRKRQARALVRALLGDAARLGLEAADLESAWHELVQEQNR